MIVERVLLTTSACCCLRGFGIPWSGRRERIAYLHRIWDRLRRNFRNVQSSFGEQAVGVPSACPCSQAVSPLLKTPKAGNVHWLALIIHPEEGTNSSPETSVYYQEWRWVTTQKPLYITTTTQNIKLSSKVETTVKVLTCWELYLGRFRAFWRQL